MWAQAIVVVVVLACTISGQSTTTPSIPTKPTSATTEAPAPAPTVVLPEWGLALTVFDDWGWADSPAQMRHLLGFPGIDKNLQATDNRGIKFTNPDIHYLSIDADVANRTVYMYDHHYGIIVIGKNYSSQMNTSEMEFKIFHHVMSLSTIQVAYDWLSRTLYWVDSQMKMVAAAPGQWEKVENDTYTIICNTHLDYPDGIAVDPFEGVMFWSDNGRHPKIEKASLDGSDRHTIITDNLKSPMTLEVDITAKRLYWIDTWTESIVSADYNGENRKFITRMTGGLLFDIAVYKDLLYVPDIDNSEMYVLDKLTGTKQADAISYWDIDETIYGVTVFSNETQTKKDKDYCALKKCEHLCVSEKYGAKCMCGVGYKLNMNTNKCDVDTGRHFKAFVYANISHICLTDIRSISSPGFFEVECIVNMIKVEAKPIRTTTNNPPAARKKRQATDSPTTTTTKAPTPQTQTPPPTTKAPTTQTPNTTTPTTTTTTIPPPTVAPHDRIKKIELDMQDRFVFFVTENDKIYRKSLDNQDDPFMVAQGSTDVTGLAYDYKDKMLYWCQGDGKIFRYELSNRESSEVDTDKHTPHKPKDLIIIVEKRKMAFIAGDEDNMGIYTMDLDGKNNDTILDAYESMTSLIYEKETEMFYFLIMGKGRIGSVPLDKSEEVELVSSSPDVNTYILMEYHSYFVWVYTSGDYPNIIMSAEKTRPYSPVGHYYFDNVSTIVDMKILDAQKQLTEPSLCAFDNGGCEHICISLLTNGNPTKACKCKKGFELAKNKMNCTSNPPNDNMIVVSDWTNDEILVFSTLQNQDYKLAAVPAKESYYYVGIHFEPDDKRLWWSAYYDSYIYSSFLNGSNTRIEADLSYSYPNRFLKDSSTGNMYYTTYFYQELGVITKSGDNIILYEDFFYENLNAIEIHTGKGYLYYAVSGYFDSYVARGYMDGTNLTKLELQHRQPNMTDLVGQVEGLAIDYVNDRIYIGDFVKDTILSCDLDGKDCWTVVNTTNEQITDLVTDGSNIYYTAYQQDYIKIVSLQPPYTHTTIGQNLGLGKINTISYYSSTNPNRQPVKNGCSKNNGLGDCSHACLPSGNPANPLKRTCACPNGIALHGDGRTCSNVIMCKEKIEHYHPETNETIKITFNDDCLRRENSTCKYTCPTNYVVADETKPTLTCQLDGWDRETSDHILCKEIRCPTSFNEGAVSEGTVATNCTRNVGSVCDFSCKENFVKSRNVLFCKEDGKWHAGEGGDFCEPYKCDETITHGKLAASCDRKVGSTCNFMCDNYYDFAPPKKLTQITCGTTGWNVNTSTLCSDARCHDQSLEHGKVADGCSKIVGRSCQYSCNRSYTNSSVEVVCKTDQKWHPAQACKTLYCPVKLENANVNITSCDLKVDSVCTYQCVGLYKTIDKNKKLKCLSSGAWNQSTNLCFKPVVKAPEAQTGGTKTTALTAGLVVLGLVILVLIVLAVFLFKRRRASLAYGTASFKNGSNVAIENPGYRETTMTHIDVKDDHPYSSVDPNQMQPIQFPEHKGPQVEAVNPMYDNEPLPEVAQVDVNQDKAVLTYDSWLKEREKDKK